MKKNRWYKRLFKPIPDHDIGTGLFDSNFISVYNKEYAYKILSKASNNAYKQLRPLEFRVSELEAAVSALYYHLDLEFNKIPEQKLAEPVGACVERRKKKKEEDKRRGLPKWKDEMGYDDE